MRWQESVQFITPPSMKRKTTDGEPWFKASVRFAINEKVSIEEE